MTPEQRKHYNKGYQAGRSFAYRRDKKWRMGVIRLALKKFLKGVKYG